LAVVVVGEMGLIATTAVPAIMPKLLAHDSEGLPDAVMI